MTSPSSSSVPATPSSVLVLRVRQRGLVVPSKKNSKRVVGDKLLTDRAVLRRIKRLQNAIGYVLYSAYQTTKGGTGITVSLPSWIASSVPLDDSLAFIPSAGFDVEYVSDGSEGVDIYIEKLP